VYSPPNDQTNDFNKQSKLSLPKHKVGCQALQTQQNEFTKESVLLYKGNPRLLKTNKNIALAVLPLQYHTAANFHYNGHEHSQD